MTRTALILALLLMLNGSLATASMPNADCVAEKVCALELSPAPPLPDPPALPAVAVDTDPLPPAPAPAGGAQ